MRKTSFKRATRPPTSIALSANVGETRSPRTISLKFSGNSVACASPMACLLARERERAVSNTPSYCATGRCAMGSSMAALSHLYPTREYDGFRGNRSIWSVPNK